MAAKPLLLALSIGAVIAMTAGLAQAAQAPTFLTPPESTSADRQAIETLLKTYTRAVTDGDQKAFEALLLNDQIPFSGVSDPIKPGATAFDPRDYKSFRKAIFESGVRYTQDFYNVHILQDGSLAEASLDFVTKETKTGRGGWGWKTLQLLKIDGQWKIASEFYTGHPLPKQG
jgi:ketosteroid isomerase-like protein